ncbi:DUF3244 domain-containing protein [Dysgonomonas sp. ZJ279]|uniref:DUF3244 domain-containing protein n=1 Tax=Dysgonomonas sp. ZJ279 TaxID=2709796 RepID=UPI0013ED3EF7|nr:DUF3244 domain-containing protein [Dysgonomonas sp. ZJ279]
MKTKKTKSCLLFIILVTFSITGSHAVANSFYSDIEYNVSDERKNIDCIDDGNSAQPRSLVEQAFKGYYIVGGYAEITFRVNLNTVSVTIAGDNGFVVYEESVNAAIKPTLNIDISNYPIGSYRLSIVGENGARYYGNFVID